MASLAMGLNHVHGTRHESLMWSKPQMQSREWLVTPINSLATTAAVGTSCPAGEHCSIQGPELGRTVDVFFSLAAGREP